MRHFRETKASQKVVELVRSDAVGNELIRTQSKIMVISRKTKTQQRNLSGVITIAFY